MLARTLQAPEAAGSPRRLDCKGAATRADAPRQNGGKAPAYVRMDAPFWRADRGCLSTRDAVRLAGPPPGGSDGEGGAHIASDRGGEARASLSAWARLCCGVDVWGQIDEQRHSRKACPSYAYRMDKFLTHATRA